jgi:YD repeat-containing protein
MELRRILDLAGGLIAGLAIAASCGVANDDSGSMVADVAADSASEGGGGGNSVPPWAAHLGYGACRDSAKDGSGARHYIYDSEGRLLRSEGAFGVVEYGYDSSGRLVQRSTTYEGDTDVVLFDWDC